jgi:flagellar export protein FliJ
LLVADLNPLIRVRKHALEQKQKFLAELYRQAEELAGQKSTLERQMQEERKLLKEMDSVDLLSYFGAYADAVKGRITDIEDAMQKLNARIEVAREDMRESFANLKKIEITQENREEAEERELNKKESAVLNEIGIDGFRRKKEAGENP